MSDEEPTEETPTFFPLRSATVLIGAATSRTNGYTPASCATTTRSAPSAFADMTSEPPTCATWILPEMSAGTPCALAMFSRSPISSAFSAKKPPSFVTQSGSSSPMMLLYETASLNGDGFGVAVAAADAALVGGVGGTAVPPPHATAKTTANERPSAARMRHLPHPKRAGQNGNTISAMRYTDLRGWIDAARELGDVREVHGASWQEDIGRITEMLHHTDDSPAVLFDDIPDYPKGFRILVNANATRRRLALTFGLPLDIERRPLMDEFLRLTEAERAIKPRVVKDGPVFENVLKGDDIDVLKFPAPFWHPHDGGRYLGTGVVDVLKDPDSDWVNLGTDPVTKLPIPAAAEIVLTGFLHHDKRAPEGPFGEWTGYYASGEREEPVLEVEAIYRRNDPIILGVPPNKPPYEPHRYREYLRSALLLRELKAAGVPGVVDAHCFGVGGCRLFNVVSIQQRYAGHARQAAHVAAMSRVGAYLGRITVVVDD